MDTLNLTLGSEARTATGAVMEPGRCPGFANLDACPQWGEDSMLGAASESADAAGRFPASAAVRVRPG